MNFFIKKEYSPLPSHTFLTWKHFFLSERSSVYYFSREEEKKGDYVFSLSINKIYI